ncbi:bifunctional 23S rRNA (guanine(2069)-N(7))-methyltransferase RlmK/23S rRNA (guanine(2445)-N(2))-methyltransferase RlmL [Pseudenhygromyxa sp. WMMC2535]|uniref:bifunctional 23S rRNA (guanine(2069)-N(7))-methyltransferase RlmK/23S rRNA (guanine(2445)-N(2))-methyltransferase RlmL n=1 Tax=Pseudenhygromyxa sp. WMMC2535 TaxID=2712867 RepID=UPI001C3D41DF|nr:bifunctional 23S rRNA (guanine(2069)-N(7))-methyltransferase RlmK/23S rRNA (guanine(2445)-N(2))-methyltransferase RlmL [Pseudenhygromyxa sp. WMMC2535]
MLRFHVTAPRGAEDLLAEELARIFAAVTPGQQATALSGFQAEFQVRGGGVGFEAPLELGCRVCLWSRIAGRVLAEIATLDATDADALYRGAREIDWEQHLPRDASLAISAGGRPTGRAIDNTHFAALRVKDAIVDQLRTRWGERPDIDRDQPDLRLHLHLRGEQATLSVDLSGEGLHRRGYRVASVAAPLRENLAAAVLARAGWMGAEDAPRPCVDPMCGSGTLLIEAASMAADLAPGLSRDRWGFEGWLGYARGEAPSHWEALLAEARARRDAGMEALSRWRFVGFDAEPASVRAALACVEAAGLHGRIHIERRALAQIDAHALGGPGLVVCNPPWGERLGRRRELERLYAALGAQLRARFVGWEAALLTGDPGLGRYLGIHADRRNVLHDGPIACQILRMRVEAPSQGGGDGSPRSAAGGAEPRPRSEGAQAFANRLVKNRKKLGKWLRREGVSCYRLYDADIPEYNVALDLYQTLRRDGSPGPLHAYVQEYAPPKEVDQQAARKRRGELLAVIREDLELPREQVHLLRRERQSGRKQYEKRGEDGRERVVAEGSARLLVNFEDYLDTGLFLDHRPLRMSLSAEDSLAAGRRVLNLFAYTGAITVHAALGGARETTSVDLSRNYLEWAKRNLALNGFSSAGPDEDELARAGRKGRHELIRADVLEWLEQQKRRWGLIICDPPSFSNSKRMDRTLDVQRDHIELIRACARLLEDDGVLIFSTNKRRFELDEDALGGLVAEPHSASVPPDFARRPGVHRAWIIRRG